MFKTEDIYYLMNNPRVIAEMLTDQSANTLFVVYK